MEPINLGNLGEVPMKPSADLLAVSDVCLAWVSATNLHVRARLAAAAIGLCWDGDERKCPPVYSTDHGEIVAYGGHVLRWLMKKHKASPYDVALAGFPIIAEIEKTIPTIKELEDAEENSDSTDPDGSSG